MSSRLDMAGDTIPMWIADKVIHHGAEATVTSGSWLGRLAVLKMRNPRAYRHPDLDRRLTKQRLSVEVRVLTKLYSSNIPTPSLLDFDLDEGWMLLSLIKGRPLYEALNDGSAGLDEISKFGALIRQLHEQKFSHGDLTTHNVLIDDDGNLTLIDFGLAKIVPEVEQLGLDLQVLSECLTASHYRIESALDVMIDGYQSADSGSVDGPTANEVINRFNSIRSRVRYHA
ncbi:MAG: Kae1-associated serine/threonine protein kinase [Euryarchaeota archaeon]|nr:Kae1-associated serine/threonine protein kinase [Euryarchaeota archaeon]MBT3653556.1 Kae1-associated serine/threonine protein kinase [Euryarchaeota archaeon]MBT3757660.1 Kae1-associated serine/threonine protein kinase [Euryarchaeota archaeon]MBT4050940.1 Kae1-associated serine/threonine protein kinase [Euryarchaeota archaeon]MBT4649671.1 Kae1-associated serine/threonine protein kinase [Euryarchaeota archaeon]